MRCAKSCWKEHRSQALAGAYSSWWLMPLSALSSRCAFFAGNNSFSAVFLTEEIIRPRLVGGDRYARKASSPKEDVVFEESGGKILIVDDDAVTSRMLAE